MQIVALATDLLACCAHLVLPAHAATYEPARLRLPDPGRGRTHLVRTARRRLLVADSAWPCADVITTPESRPERSQSAAKIQYGRYEISRLVGEYCY